MNRCRLVLLVVVLGVMADPARAGIFFNRKPKPQAPDRVPTLLSTLRTDPSEQKRAEAAEELRNFDGGVNPEIVPALIETALKDPQASVRIQAIQSLGKLRPISQFAGRAIEQAAANDPSMRVQLQARSALLQYRMSGYHSSKGDAVQPLPMRTIRTEEPPLAVPLETPPAIRHQPQPAPLPSGPAIVPSSASRPMRAAPVSATAPVVPAPVQAPPAIVPAPALATPPADDGPQLTAPR